MLKLLIELRKSQKTLQQNSLELFKNKHDEEISKER